MGDHAEWRPYANDPRSVLGWTLLSIVQEFPRVMVSTFAALIFVALGLLFFAIAGDVDFFSFGAGWSLPSRKRRAALSLSYLAPLPSRDPWYPVHFELMREGLVTGFDDGIAIFGDGWLHIEGRRTMFTLPADRLSDAACGDGCLVVLAGQSLQLRPYDRMGDEKGLSSDFDAAFRRLRSRVATGAVALRRPPLEVHLSAFGRCWGGLILGGLLMAAGTAAIVWGSWAGWFVGGVVTLCGAWRAGRAVWHLWRLRGLAHSSS